MLAEALAVCVDSNINVPPPAIPAKSVTLLTDVLFTAVGLKIPPVVKLFPKDNAMLILCYSVHISIVPASMFPDDILKSTALIADVVLKYPAMMSYDNNTQYIVHYCL
jgi:hypothetical protein